MFQRVIKINLIVLWSISSRKEAHMKPYELFVADKIADESVLVWRKVCESDSVSSLLVLAVHYIPLNEDDEVEYAIVAPDGEFIVTSLYMDQEFMKGGQVS
jgi:hypothetical protein